MISQFKTIGKLTQKFGKFGKQKSLKMRTMAGLDKTKKVLADVGKKTKTSYKTIKTKFSNLSPIEKTVALGVGIGLPVKAGALYLGAREGTKLAKQKKNGKKK